MTDALHARGKTLEDLFFEERDRELLARLRKKAEAEQTLTDLRGVTGIQNQAVLERIVGLGVKPETLSAFSLVPLLHVAWADRELDPAERAAILVEAEAMGLAHDSAAFGLLQAWLERGPSDDLFEAWQSFHTSLAPHLSAEERAQIRDDLTEKARRIARASGGVLGIGAVSGVEKAALERIEALLG